MSKDVLGKSESSSHPPPGEGRAILISKNFNAYFGTNHVLKNINIEIETNLITAIMGPSGCGKTTFIRCINRMHELTPGATVDGQLLHGSHA